MRRGERSLAKRIEAGDPYWPPQLALAIALGLDVALSDQVTPGPRWLPAVVAGLLLAVLVVTTWGDRATEHVQSRRHLALAVITLVSAFSLVALGMLVEKLINGGQTEGKPLIGSGTLLLVNDVLLFAVWYWELDRGGPVERFRNPDTRPDFQFTQMDNPHFAVPNWRPGFGDYLYLSLTNTQAFSPTDTMPLTHAAKSIMGLQAVASMVTIGLVIARAVNILG
jgi:hypothetical protein